MQRFFVLGALTALLLVGCGDPDEPPDEPPSYYSGLSAVTTALG